LKIEKECPKLKFVNNLKIAVRKNIKELNRMQENLYNYYSTGKKIEKEKLLSFIKEYFKKYAEHERYIDKQLDAVKNMKKDMLINLLHKED
jgi:hypothetical protein